LRVAVTTGVLQIPPTYFLVNHALALRKRFDFEVFTLVARVPNDLGIPVHDTIPFRAVSFSRRMGFGPLGLPAMQSDIRRFSPDLIHQHFATWSGPAIAAAGKQIPLLTTVHGYDVFVATRPPRNPLERWHARNVARSARRSRRVLAVSEYLASRAISAGFDSARLQVHYQGVDTEFFTPDEGTTGRSDRPVVLFVGGLFERKGIRDLLDASCRLIKTVEHSLVVVGDGPLAGLVDERSEEFPHIVRRGSIDRTLLRDEMRGATVLVLPTQEHAGWREAAGLVLVEAQACGTPVVAYRSGGTPEMLDENHSGLLAPEKDIDALTAAIGEVLALGEDDYRRMRRAARKFAHEQRSLDRSCRELVEHYDSLIA
jgi:glycosyltransferase involved in cell wall biosynthesis